MKIQQLLQVALASLIISLCFSEKLPAKGIVINNNQEGLGDKAPTNGGSNLSQFLTQMSQTSQELAIDCNLKNQDKGGASTPEPTLISGLIFVGGLGLWSNRKKLNRN